MASRRYVFVLEQQLGHVTHALNISRALAEEPDIEATIIRVPDDPGLPAGLSNWSIQGSLMARDKLHRRLAEGPAEAVFVHTQVIALAIKGMMRKVPTIVSLDATPINIDSMADAYNHRRHPAAIERLKRQVTRRSLSAAAAVVTWSDWAARSVTDDYAVPAGKVTRIYPGVDVARFSPGEDRPADRPMRVLFVGGDFQRKGGPELIEAAAAMDHPVELDLVTPDRSVFVPARVVARVHRDVKPNSPEMTALYNGADVFALPTKGDALPLVIAEAMASGLPIIATTVGAIPDAVTNGLNGLLVEPGDVIGLSAALSRLDRDPALRREMGATGRKAAEAEHDAVANAKRIFWLLDRVAGNPPD
jgi:glycosyltransferase involved in cell wall biosynthesis